MIAAARIKDASPLSPEFFMMSPEERNSFRVSDRSRWGDDVWYFAPRRAGLLASRTCYRWLAFPGPAGLIEDCKLFIWSIHHENLRGRAAKTSSAPRRAYTLRRFLRWMQHEGLETLGQLPAGFGTQYLSYLLEQPGVGKLRDHSIGSLLDLPVHVFQQAQVMRAAGRDSIQYHPYGGRNPFALAKDHGEENGTIPPVPDDLFIATAAEVGLWLERNSVDVVRLAARAVEANHSGEYDYEKWRAYGVNKALRGARFDGTGVEWRPPLGDSATVELADLLMDLRAACVIGLQAFTGIRINEALSLESEPRDPKTGWPACLSVRSSRNGLMDVFYIRGRLVKGQDDFAEVEWVAGARPAGSAHLPPPVRAVIVLEEMFRPWRVDGVTRLVLSTRWGCGGLPANTLMKPCSYGAAAQDQVRFIARHVYALQPELAERLNWWRVSTHQWRKSFAQFVVRSDERLLRAVSEHFKHVSLAMTSENYVGNDVELLGLVDDEALHRVAEVTMLAISGDLAIAGPLAEIIDRQRERITREVGNGTLDQQVAALRDILRYDNVRSWACGWGDCFFRPETARCHAEVKGTYVLSARRPNPETRRPEVCCECANLVVLPEHRPFWDARLQKNRAIVDAEQDNNSPGTRVAQVRVEQATKILRRLDAALERINAKKRA